MDRRIQDSGADAAAGQDPAGKVPALPDGIEIVFYGEENDEFSRNLESFARNFCEEQGRQIKFRLGTENQESAIRPCFRISAGARRGAAYSAIPRGHQWPLFLQALRRVCEDEPPAVDNKGGMAGDESPAEIWVLISMDCPRCPKVVEAVLDLADRHSRLSLQIIDAQSLPNLAEKFGIKSVPATVIDRQLVWTGQLSAERLAGLLSIRGTEKYDGELIRSLLERNRSGEAAAMLIQGRGKEAILSLFLEGDFSTRLGVLMVLENALEKKPEVVRTMLPSLIPLLSHQDSRIRGDIADFLGRVGDPRVLPHLERLLSDADPDVAEAATDALAALRHRGNSRQ